MVYAGIKQNDKAVFIIFEGGTVTSQKYYRKNILDHVRLFKDAVDPDFCLKTTVRDHTEPLKYGTHKNEKILNVWNSLFILRTPRKLTRQHK